MHYVLAIIAGVLIGSMWIENVRYSRVYGARPSPYAGAVILRVGNVIYWTATGLAIAILGTMALSIATQPHVEAGMQILGVGFGVMLWLFGRGCRYVLAGR